MALGRQRDHQAEMLVSWVEMPRSPGHAFYDKLQGVLIAAGFARFVEPQCAVEYAPRLGRPSLPPGRYFRMLLIGYFEGIDSERGLEWRCADSLSLREFLRLGERERVPDHSWLSRTRSRLSLEVHDQVFSWMLKRLAEHGLLKGERIGVDASTIEANAALRTIVRRDSGEGYREMLTRLAQESGIETPTTEDLVRLDRKRKGKKLSNADWESPTDPDARIAKLKDGRTHLAYKPEHAMDLDTGAVVAAEMHLADQGDTTTMPDTLSSAAEHLNAVDATPTSEAPAELIADKGYHSRAALKALDGGPWKSRISEPHHDEFLRFGTAMMRRGGRSITIGHGCSRELRGRRSSCELNWWNAASPSSSIAAACAGSGCAAARTCRSATSCRRVQLGIAHAAADRGGDAPGVPEAGIRVVLGDPGARRRADRHDSRYH